MGGYNRLTEDDSKIRKGTRATDFFWKDIGFNRPVKFVSRTESEARKMFRADGCNLDSDIMFLINQVLAVERFHLILESLISVPLIK